ncbi:MAG: VOC family protein [Myxococcota bacterium]
MASQLSQVIVFAKDVGALSAFYRAAFGFEEHDRGDGFVELTHAGTPQIALHALPDAIAGQIEITSPPAWRGDTAYKVCFAAEDLDATRAAIVDAGGVAKDIWTWQGRRRCDCADAEGNVLQLVEQTD